MSTLKLTGDRFSVESDILASSHKVFWFRYLKVNSLRNNFVQYRTKRKVNKLHNSLKMNWFLVAAVSVAFVANIANAVQDKAFKERAEIYSSEIISYTFMFRVFI